MKKLICTLLICSIIVTGCAGSNPNPVNIYRPGDEKKSCSSLKATITLIDKQIEVKRVRQTEKAYGNAACAITGFFIIVPWFFMDLKGAEQVEIDALQQRKEALNIIAIEKDCEF